MRLLIALLTLLSSPLLWAASPSFECRDIGNNVEAALCLDDDLAALDRKMANVYDSASRSMAADDQQAEQSAQDAWIRSRNSCGDVPDIGRCITASYDARITELQIKGGLVTKPAPVVFDCGKAGVVTAYFYDDTQEPAAVLNVGESLQDTAISQPTWSGAKYRGKKVTFWRKGDSAQLIRAGQPDASCTKQKTKAPAD